MSLLKKRPSNHFMSDKLQLLIKQSRKGNQLAQVQIYDMYCQAMYNVAYRYLNNAEDAKDIMQEAFLKAFFKLGSFEDKTTFGSWLKRIVINQCLDQIKKQRLDLVFDESMNIEQVDDHLESDVTISREEVIATIATLKEKYALILKLYLIEGYDHVEISEILDIPVKTSRIQLHRGKKLLKEQLKTNLDETGS